MEAGLGALHWLHGLEDYFEFTDNKESNQFVRFLLKLLYADNPTITTTDNSSMEEFVYTLRKFTQSDILDILYKYYRQGHDPVAIQDAFSRGQVQSKVWLATELAKITDKADNILILASWFGQLVRYIDHSIDFDKVRLVDMDETACKVSDYIFNLDKLEGYRVKSTAADLNDLVLQKNGYILNIKDFKKEKTFEEKFLPDVIINTSAEHMSDDWFFQIKFKELDSQPIVVVQSNNLFEIPEHVNCVHSIDHMLKKFPMSEVLYSGEIQLKGYKRFMLIGRP